ncbi:MAG: hypothetical protein PVSMB4_02990 [Ktedonobacterales bacterium]
MDAAVVEALNQLLEGERACVEALVGLASMATDFPERHALMIMGGQAAQACSDLHEQLARADAPIGLRIGGAVSAILAPDRLDDRLLTFSVVQQDLADAITALHALDLDDDTRSLLASLHDVHLAHAAWSARRAAEFAASRQLALEPVVAHGVPSQGAPPSECMGSIAAERHDVRQEGASAGSPDGVASYDSPGYHGQVEPPTSRGRSRRTHWSEQQQTQADASDSDPTEW